MLSQVADFVHSNQFWYWHGFVLSGLWVLVSAIAILLKKLNTTIHVFLFICTNLTSIFFIGSALYRVSSNLHNFMDWPPLKQCHIIGGTIFLLLLIIEHLGGATAFFGKKQNPQHRAFGKILVIIGRCIACVGWILGGDIRNAIIVGVVSLIITIISFIIPPSSKTSASAQSNERARPKSPRPKRQ